MVESREPFFTPNEWKATLVFRPQDWRERWKVEPLLTKIVAAMSQCSWATGCITPGERRKGLATGNCDWLPSDLRRVHCVAYRVRCQRALGAPRMRCSDSVAANPRASFRHDESDILALGWRSDSRRDLAVFVSRPRQELVRIHEQGASRARYV